MMQKYNNSHMPRPAPKIVTFTPWIAPIKVRRLPKKVKTEPVERAKTTRYQNDPVLAKQYKHLLKDYLQDRATYLSDLKTICESCGEQDSRCLVFHHLDPKAKEFTLGQAVNMMCYGLFDLLREVQKCQVLCCNCHAKLHHG